MADLVANARAVALVNDRAALVVLVACELVAVGPTDPAFPAVLASLRHAVARYEAALDALPTPVDI
jgi:hypothetical protein